MKTIKLLTVLIITTIFITSCDKDEIVSQENFQQEESSPKDGETSLTAKNQKYRNFNFTTNSKTPAKVIAHIKKSIDQIYSSGLKKSTITKMTKVKSIHVAQDIGVKELLYEPHLQRVILNDYKDLFDNSNINYLLHELTHYYEHKHFSKKDKNKLASLMANARKKKIYPNKAYVMINRSEYIATSIEAYFSKGSTKRQPFNRKTVQQKDPQMVKFIKAKF